MIPQAYTLPDAVLLAESQYFPRHLIWRPTDIVIVLGHANQPEKSLRLENVIKDRIPVYKRPSGGEAVLLSPRTLAISALVLRNGISDARRYFRYFNRKIMAALTRLGVKNLAEKGVSDIALGEQKILGSAIYQDKDRVFYQAILNAAEFPDLIENYLKLPSIEPPYRQGRRHIHFVTSLADQGYRFSPVQLSRAIEAEFSRFISGSAFLF